LAECDLNYLNPVDGRYSYQDKTLYGQITNPGFFPVPSFNPYLELYHQQEQLPSGWFYSYEYPNLITVGDLFSVKKTTAPVCGAGPANMTATRELASERIIGGTSAKANAWPFMVCLFHYII
jgi:hypothetical protein